MPSREGDILQEPSPEAVYTAWTGAGGGTWGWISPATSGGTLMWTESQPAQTGHSDLLKEISKLSPLKSEKCLSILSSSQARVRFSSVGPHTKDKTHKVEMVQRLAARWTFSDYTRTTTCVVSLHCSLS